MPPVEAHPGYKWFCAGDEIFPAMLAAIEEARSTVCLEMYIFSDGSLGQRFREALVRAQQRGVQVRVLLDALGARGLPGDYWDALRGTGGQVRLFNPLTLKRVWFRDHRKLLICDQRVGFVGGFNIAAEYEGDGILSGWRDVGLRIEGALAVQLTESFEQMFSRADFQHKIFMRLRRGAANRFVASSTEQILLSGPGRGQSPIKRALRSELAQAREAQIMMGYFLPSWGLRRELTRVVQRGGRVQLMLAGKSDVSISQLAARSLYRRCLKGGAQVFEYQPQVLHAKLLIVDDVVYVGSSNLDPRSLQINYELMVRFQNRDLADGAREMFANSLNYCCAIELQEWRQRRTFWQKLKQRLAYFLLVRIDPYMARQQWRALPD